MKKLLAILLCIITVLGTTQITSVIAADDESIIQTKTVKPEKVVITEYKRTRTAVKLTWKKQSENVKYRVYIYNNEQKKFKAVSDTKKNSYTVKKLEPSTKYKFAVKAYIENDGKKIAGEVSETLTVKTKSVPTPAKLTGVKITNGGKSKQLKISWKAQDGVTGYQVYRSTTGKTGSYKKIATLDNTATSYTDKSLKASTTYYYAVRAYNKAGSTTKYGSYAKVYGSTMLTNSFVAKKYNEAAKICSDWVSYTAKYIDDRDYITVKNDVHGYDDYYARVNHETINTKSKLVNYLNNYFSKELSKKIVNDYYMEKNGKLYVLTIATGDLSYMSLSETTAKIVSQSDKECVADVILVERGYFDTDTYETTVECTMVYENGKWVFDSSDHWVMNLWQCFDTIQGLI